jgi:hypothetical protein
MDARKGFHDGPIQFGVCLVPSTALHLKIYFVTKQYLCYLRHYTYVVSIYSCSTLRICIMMDVKDDILWVLDPQD